MTTKKKENTEVATRDEGVLTATELPDFMKDKKATGLENLESSDFVMPLVKLLQATDMSVQEGLAQAGDFFHVTFKENLGKRLLFIACDVRKRYMLFKPNEEQGQGSNVLARADDGIHWSPADAEFEVKLKGKKEAVTWATAKTVIESGLDQFGSSDPEDPKSRPAATLIYDIVAILPEHPASSPAIISLKGDSVKKARSWFTEIKRKGVPIYGLMFEMFGSVEKNGNNIFQAYNIIGKGFVKSEVLFKQGEELNKLCQMKSVRADQEDGPDAAPAGHTAPTNPNY